MLSERAPRHAEPFARRGFERAKLSIELLDRFGQFRFQRRELDLHGADILLADEPHARLREGKGDTAPIGHH